MLWFLPVAFADPLLDARLASADLLASNPAPAAELLEPWVEQYPEDYALRMELAWATWSAGDPTTARTHYVVARELSRGSFASRLGVVACDLAAGKPGAREAFAALRTERPDDPGVLALEPLGEPGPTWFIGVGLEGGRLSYDGERSALGGLRASVHHEGRISGGVLAGVWGYSDSSTLFAWAGEARWAGGTGNGNGNGNATGETDGDGTQAGAGNGDAYGTNATAGPWSTAAEAGLSTALWGHVGTRRGPVDLQLVAAGLLDLDDPSPGGVLGLTTTVELPVPISAEVGWTRPAGFDLDVLHTGVSGWVEHQSLAVQPAVRLQLADGAVWPAAGATVYVVRPAGSVWIGGRYGNEVHATDLALLRSIRWPDPVAGSLWAGSRFGRLDRFHLVVELDVPLLPTGEPLPWLGLATVIPLRGVP